MLQSTESSRNSAHESGISAARETMRLRLLPVEGIDILGSGVPEQQRCIVGRKSQCRPVTSDRTEILELDEAFDLAVADSNSEERALSPRVPNVNVLSVLRPIRVAEDPFGKLTPPSLR